MPKADEGSPLLRSRLLIEPTMTKRFPYCPLFLDLENREVLIVGGGTVSARKAEMLMRYGARITVVSPEIASEIEEWERGGRLTTRRKRFEASDLEGATLVIASTADGAVNTEVADGCRSRRIPVNVVDLPELGDFIVPAVIDKGSVQIAISTGGKSPALARRLKADLDRQVGSEYAEVNDLLGSLRDAAKKALPTDSDRKRFFDALLDAGVLELLHAGRRHEAFEAVARACEASNIEMSELLRKGLAER